MVESTAVPVPEPPVLTPFPAIIQVDDVIDPLVVVPPPEQSDPIVVHFDAPIDSPITRVLLIDRRITKYDEIIASLNVNTACVIFDYDTDTFETMRTNGINRIAPDNRVVCGSDERPTIIGYSPRDDADYDPLLNLGFALPLQYLGIMQHRADGVQYFATANETGCQLNNVAETDPMLNTWANYIAFLSACKRDYGVGTYDIMACSTYSDPNWKYVINEIEARCDIVIRSSLDDTGSAKLGGNWFLLAGGSSTTTTSASAATAAEAETETETVDLTTVYFTDEILKYEFSLASSQSSNVFVMDATGSAYCWGRSAQLQLHPTIASVKLPIRWSTLTNIIASVQPAYSVAALTADGYVYTAGQESYILGPGRDISTATARIPTAITGYFGTVMQISCGYTFIMILLHTGIVAGWGTNTYGQLSGTASTTPEYISYIQPAFGNNGITNSDFVSISCGAHHVAALKSNGLVYTWGLNNLGQCGQGNSTSVAPINTPEGAMGFSTNASTFYYSPIVQVSASYYSTVVVACDGYVYGCGYTFRIDVTVGYWVRVNQITTALCALYVVNALCNDNYINLLMSDGTIWSMGDNTVGQLGIGSITNNYLSVSNIIKAAGIENVIAISGSGAATIAITTNGSVYSWGYNGEYQLCNGNTVTTSRPAKIMNLVGSGVNALTLGSTSGGFYSGIIATIAARAALSTMLNLNTASLLFRYVGVPQSDFNAKYHAAVDDRRAILVVVKSTTGAVALGYFGPKFQSSGGWLSAPIGQTWTCPFMAPDASGNTLSTVKYYTVVAPPAGVTINSGTGTAILFGDNEIRIGYNVASVGNNLAAGSEIFENPPNGLLGNGTGIKSFTVSAIEVFYAPQIYGAFNATTSIGTSKNIITSTAATTALATMVEASSMRLLFKSSGAALSIAGFNAACDGAGSTLMVIKATNGAVALAYSSVNWINTGSYVAADRGSCWLCPFMSPTDGGNTVSSLRYYNIISPTISIYGSTDRIAFGGGHDLYINGNGDLSIAPNSYQSPPNGLFGNGTGYKTGFLAGIEVYSAVSIGFSQSIITSVDGITAANTMVKNPRLLFKSSGSSFSGSEYHAACSYKGPLLFVIKSSGDVIAMAYASVTSPFEEWLSPPSYTCWLCPFQASSTSTPKTVKYYNTGNYALLVSISNSRIYFGFGTGLNIQTGSSYETNFSGHDIGDGGQSGGYELRPNGLFTNAPITYNSPVFFTLSELEVYAADPAETVLTTCGLRGPYGPTLENMISTYGQTTTSINIKLSPPATGVQQWVVPITGTYLFRVCGGIGAGAYAGYDNTYMNPGYSGFVNAKFRLTVGQVLRFICGQRAAFKATGNQYNGGGGGGGGTFVIDEGTGTLLIASGGGGGAGIYTTYTAPNVEADVYARVWTYSATGGAFNYTHDGATWGTQRIPNNGESGAAYQSIGSLTDANLQLVPGYSSIGWADMYKNFTYYANGAIGGGTWNYKSFGGFGGGGAPLAHSGAGGGGWCGGNALRDINGYWGGGYGASYINTGWIDYVSTGDTSVVSTSPNGYVQLIKLYNSQTTVTLGFTQTIFVVKYVLNSTFTIPAGITTTNNADSPYVVTHVSQSAGIATITNSANVGTVTVIAKGTVVVASSIAATTNYTGLTVSLITIVIVGSGTTYYNLAMNSVDLSGADLTGSVFSGSCNLTGANLYGTTINSATDLRTATLTGVKSGRIVGEFTTLLPAGYKMI